MTETLSASHEGVPLRIEQLGGPRRIGPIEVSQDVAYEPQGMAIGRHEVVSDDPTSTGRLLRFVAGEEFAVKTFLSQGHGFLQFSHPWQRLWSLGAECQKAQEGQRDWSEPSRTHLGVVGVRRVSTSRIVVTDAATIDGREVEPGLLMRWLPEETNLPTIMQQDPQRFLQLVPAAIAAIADNEVTLPPETGARYGGADGIRFMIDRGNLQALRYDFDPRVRKFAGRFWESFSEFSDRYSVALDQRALTGNIVWGNGDTKVANMFEVDGCVGIIDPITLLLKTGDSGEYTLAPWPFRDRISELAYFTCYFLAGMRLSGSALGLVYDQALAAYEQRHNERVSEGPARALLSFHEAALAQVEFEVSLRLSRDPDCRDRERRRDLAWALHDVAQVAIEDAHLKAEVAGLEKGIL